MFQSPSHRGGSAPLDPRRFSRPRAAPFQSPSHRGGSAPNNGFASFFLIWPLRFQSPSHRGGSAPGQSRRRPWGGERSFNPLLIGAGALPFCVITPWMITV